MSKKKKKQKKIHAEGVRIQKYLASVGVASRRGVEEIIEQGGVEVNGKVITKLPCFVIPEKDEIVVEGSKIRRKRGNFVYYLVNKPKGVICTSNDPEGRISIIDMIPPSNQRVYCVGRLDADSTGLVLLTNDGEMTNRLTHPRYGVEKTYLVNVTGRVEGSDIQKILAGQYNDGKRTRPAGIKIIRRNQNSTLLEIKLREGKNREIRRLIARRGYKVRRLRRVAIGPLTDRGLKAGNYRPIDNDELSRLRKLCSR